MPKKTEGYHTFHLKAKQNRKHKEAQERQSDYDSLTIAEKISLAVKRGGSKRELARLDKKQAEISAIPIKVKPTKVPKTIKK